MPKLTPEILKAIRAVVDYNWVDEEADFAEHEEDREFHIFHSLKMLEDFLTDCTLATAPAVCIAGAPAGSGICGNPENRS